MIAVGAVTGIALLALFLTRSPQQADPSISSLLARGLAITTQARSSGNAIEIVSPKGVQLIQTPTISIRSTGRPVAVTKVNLEGPGQKLEELASSLTLSSSEHQVQLTHPLKIGETYRLIVEYQDGPRNARTERTFFTASQDALDYQNTKNMGFTPLREGVALIELGRFDEAVTALKKAGSEKGLKKNDHNRLEFLIQALESKAKQ
jgi:hypothetical protein